jgi:predicted transcriptional regulator
MFLESILKFGKPYKARRGLLQMMSENIYKGQQLEQQQKKPRPLVTEGRRSVLQIRVDILRVIMEGYGKPTQIMYKANLSWNVLQSQLKSFLETDMLTVEEYGSRRKYAITPKGVEMVRAYQRVVDEILG